MHSPGKMKRKIKELAIVTSLLDKYKLTYDVKETPNVNESIGRHKDHYTVYIPKEKDFSYLVSFNIPFEGYRCAAAGAYQTRYDTYIDTLEPFVAGVAQALRPRSKAAARRK